MLCSLKSNVSCKVLPKPVYHYYFQVNHLLRGVAESLRSELSIIMMTLRKGRVASPLVEVDT